MEKGKRAANKKASDEDGEWTQVGSAPNNLKLATPPTKKETETVQPPTPNLPTKSDKKEPV